MATSKHLEIVRLDDCVIIDASKAEKRSENSPDKIQITLAARRWIPGKDKLMSVEHVKFFEFYTRVKVTPEIWERLKLLGLRKGSVCDSEFASDGWSMQNSGNSGSWYQFLGLIRLNGQNIDYFIYKNSGDNRSTGLNSWEQPETDLVEAES